MSTSSSRTSVTGDDNREHINAQIAADEAIARELTHELEVRGDTGDDNRGHVHVDAQIAANETLAHKIAHELEVGGVEELPDMLMQHFCKVRNPTQDPAKPVQYTIYCNYCSQKYTFMSGGGYNMLVRHMIKKHPTEYRR